MHQFEIKNTIPMIRISFDTQTNSEDPDQPEAWRGEAAAVLREIANRIAAGESMPLILMGREGRFLGKAREISYQPEPARQPAADLRRPAKKKKRSFSDS